MRKLFVVERRDHFTVAAQSEEGAIEEANAMMCESMDESLDPFEVLGSYDEWEDEDRDMAELIGELRALEQMLEWTENVHEGRDVRTEVEIHIRERIDVVSKKLLEMA